MQTMSGRTPACSTANSVPVRPKPVATSSHDQEHVGAPARGGHRGELGRLVQVHAVGALHQRLEDDRGHPVPVLGEERLEGLDGPGVPRRGERSTGKRSGSNTSVPKPPSPTESPPTVSPWYAAPKAT